MRASDYVKDKLAALDSREVAAYVTGVVLIAIAFVAAGVVPGGGGIGFILALGGLTAILYALIGSRLKSVGPKGIELFEQLKEATAIRVAEAIEATAGETGEAPAGVATGRGTAYDATVRTSSANAAASIRAARTPEELAEAIAAIATERSQSGRVTRIAEDDATRRKQDRYGPSHGSR